MPASSRFCAAAEDLAFADRFDHHGTARFTGCFVGRVMTKRRASLAAPGHMPVLSGQRTGLRSGRVMPDTVSIGQRLYSLTQFCTKVCLGPKRDDAELERLATEAWNLLQSISEEEVEALPLRDVAEIVVAYNHFCGFWANGLNGPARAVRDGKSSGQVSTSSSQFGVDEQPQTYPIMERFDVASGNGETLLNKAVPQPLDGCEVPVRRASPLDEILEF
ncbi:hypothetical protein CGC20_6740 [Leishmania donovani]|uniref:RNA-editing substrate-binding complex 7 protein domain-containing protein n=1 Tax=Leishmania donovani TaxID=5661 RepID=A0A504X588_LEIDO|nr:hypothetical protein CGC20_6740 [Leishmania donovani]TPP45772.1 hypothetical protein CGC21_35815 [Leishmania donovani]